MKHGVSAPGEWNILGIVDALPSIGNDVESAVDAYANAQSDLEGDFGSPESLALHGFSALIDGVVPFARRLLGRKDHHYGATPPNLSRSNWLKPTGKNYAPQQNNSA